MWKIAFMLGIIIQMKTTLSFVDEIFEFTRRKIISKIIFETLGVSMNHYKV